MTSASVLQIIPVDGLPEIAPGDDLAALTVGALEAMGLALQDLDVLAVAQKIVSKSEGCYRSLAEVNVSGEARALAAEVDKDPRLVQLILDESVSVEARRPGLVVVEHRLGHVTANAGIDRSNVPGAEAEERVLLLPEDPDASAERLRAELAGHYACRLGCVVTDTLGRPFRNGVVGMAIGAAGLPALRDQRGRRDREGRELRVTQTGFADEIAAAASLLMGQADESRPLVLVRGLSWAEPAVPARALQRERAFDLFR